MTKILFRGALLAVTLMLLTAYGALCQGINESATVFQKIDVLLNQGDNHQAWQLLQNIPETKENLDEKLWRLARLQYEMGRIAALDQNAMGFYLNAEKFARAAIANRPDSADGYKWLAIALGAQSIKNDTETQIRLSREIKENIEKALALAPDDDLACLVLSRWHYKISGLNFFSRSVSNIVYNGLPEASLDEAEKLLRRAIALHDRITHRYNLAKVYERINRKTEAKVQLQQALLLPVTFPEEAEALEKSRKKLLKWL